MVTTIDRAGRIVVPKEIRDKAGLRSDVPLEIRYREGRVEIEPAPTPVRLARKGRLLVAVPKRRLPSLEAEPVEATRARIRRERAGLAEG